MVNSFQKKKLHRFLHCKMTCWNIMVNAHLSKATGWFNLSWWTETAGAHLCSFRSHCHSPPAKLVLCTPWMGGHRWTLGPPDCHLPNLCSPHCLHRPRRPHPHQSHCLLSETAGRYGHIITTTISVFCAQFPGQLFKTQCQTTIGVDIFSF